MQDACKAKSSDLRSSFGDSTKILMCWFKVMLNVKMNFSVYGVPEQLGDSQINDGSLILRIDSCRVILF